MNKYHKVFSIARECPICHGKSKTINVRDDKSPIGTTRRRECVNCGTRWNTVELLLDEFAEDYNAGRYD